MLILMPGVEAAEIKRASAGKPIPGYDIKIFDEEGYELEPHHEGYLVIKLPLPPGALLGIWGDYEISLRIFGKIPRLLFLWRWSY
jgi:propionyl-CoA synthetase